jgi:hypothetical protein
LLGVIACILLAGCGEPAESRPPDIPGTIETATRLTLGGHGVLGDETTPVKVCMNPDGLCVPAHYRVDECYRYDDIEAIVDGTSIPLVWAGGWTPIPIFEPLPSGGSGHGCAYPGFALDDLGARAASTTQELTIRVGHESATVTVKDWLLERTITVPETLVRGTDVFVGVEPQVRVEQRQEDSQGTYILYDDPELDLEWCKTKYPTSESCLAPSISTVDPASWNDEGFVLRVPATLPIGTGLFGFNEAWLQVEATSCPFTACEVTVNRSTEMPVSITEMP